MDVLNSIHKAISQLAGLTDILSGDDYVTISAVNPIVDLIEKKLLASQSDDTELSKSLMESIITDLKLNGGIFNVAPTQAISSAMSKPRSAITMSP